MLVQIAICSCDYDSIKSDMNTFLELFLSTDAYYNTVEHNCMVIIYRRLLINTFLNERSHHQGISLGLAITSNI